MLTTGPRATASRPHRPVRRRSFAGSAITALVLVGLGAFAYVRFNAAPLAVTPSLVRAPAASAPQAAAPAFRCDGRTHCAQMKSCAEAKFFLQNCPGPQMDGDGDGRPCEEQWCNGVLGW